MKTTALKIVLWPNKILKTPARQVERVDKEIASLLEKMYVAMLYYKGIGLAANQLGLNLRLAVVSAEDKVFKLVNPRILKKEGRFKIVEGCLSFPGLELEIKRAKRVWVSSLDEKARPLEIEAEGLLAVVFQHEIDHLEGIPFIYRVPLWKRLKALSSLKKKNKTSPLLV